MATTIKAPFFEIGSKSYLYGDQILDLPWVARVRNVSQHLMSTVSDHI